MKTHLLFTAVFLYATTSMSMYTIRGRVTTDDTTRGVPAAEIRIYGFDTRITDKRGFFILPISEEKCAEYSIRGGIDLTIGITTKDSLVLLDPFNGKIRLPFTPDKQEEFRIRLVKKGSLLLTRNEDVLYSILQKKIEAAVNARDQQFEKRDVLAEEAQRLGVNKTELARAVEEYKRRRCSTDELLRCALAAIDDRQPDTAISRLNQIQIRFETTLAEAAVATKELPSVYYNKGLAWYEKVVYDTALGYFTKADSMQPGNSEWLIRIGLTLDRLGHYDKAISFYSQALAIDTVVYGKKHPKVAISYNNLGGAYHSKGDYDKAISFYLQALAIDTVVYGKNHPQVAICYNNLGEAWRAKGDYDKAISFYMQALAIDTVVYGKKHPQVAICYNNLGSALASKGDYDKAISFYLQALAIDTVVYGKKHPDVAIDYNNLGEAWGAKGEYDKAISFFSQALAIDTVVYGKKHPKVAIRYNNLGLTWDSKGNYDKAISFYLQALAIDTVVYGKKHPDVAIDYNNLGSAWRAKGEYDKAISFYLQALAIDTVVYGKKHPDVAIRYNNLGSAWSAKGDYDKARACLIVAIECAKPFWPDNHPSMITLRRNLADIPVTKSK